MDLALRRLARQGLIRPLHPCPKYFELQIAAGVFGIKSSVRPAAAPFANQFTTAQKLLWQYVSIDLAQIDNLFTTRRRLLPIEIQTKENRFSRARRQKSPNRHDGHTGQSRRRQLVGKGARPRQQHGTTADGLQDRCGGDRRHHGQDGQGAVMGSEMGKEDSKGEKTSLFCFSLQDPLPKHINCLGYLPSVAIGSAVDH